jgi:hypothetical protein
MFGLSKKVKLSLPLGEEIAEMRKFTPDMADLERQYGQFYFAYDEMKHLHPQNKMLDDQLYIHPAFTAQHYVMLKHDLGADSHPLLFEGGLKDRQNPPESLPIYGELGIITPRLFLELDKYKQNGVSFYRKKVPIVIPCTELFFKDRQHAQAVFEHPRPIKNKDGSPQFWPNGTPKVSVEGQIGKSLIRNQGVFRVWAWIYFADFEFWNPILWNVADDVQIHSAKGLIKRCYNFTLNEYEPPGK